MKLRLEIQYHWLFKILSQKISFNYLWGDIKSLDDIYYSRNNVYF